METPVIKVKSTPKVKVSVLSKHTAIPNDYNKLKNIPALNGVEIKGQLSASDLKILSSIAAEYGSAALEDTENGKLIMFTADGEVLVLAISELQNYEDLKNIPTFDGKKWKGALTADELKLLTSKLADYTPTTIEASKTDKIVILSTGGERFILTLSDLLDYVKSYDMGEQITVDDDGDVEATLTPNIYYLFTGEITSLSISFGEAKTSRYNEFKGQFSTGSTVPVVSFPASVKWVGEEFPELEADRTYQFSVLNDIGVIVGV